jgi:hypothetical protein
VLPAGVVAAELAPLSAPLLDVVERGITDREGEAAYVTGELEPVLRFRKCIRRKRVTEPILRLLNLQLQRLCFFKVEKNLKTR